MEAKTPVQKLRELGLELHDSFALQPPIVMDTIAGTIVTQDGYDAPAKYHLKP